MSEVTLDVLAARDQFPSLKTNYIFADNAGGSQCLSAVVSRISDYLLYTNVQLGADYAVSVTSTQRVADGIEAVRDLINAESVDEVAMGSSSTMLAENLGRAIEGDILDGEEIIVTGEHEGEHHNQFDLHGSDVHAQPTLDHGRNLLHGEVSP